MINSLEKLTDWIMYEAKITTQLQLDAHEAFCAHPTKDLGRVFWCVSGGFEEISWDAID